MPRCNLIFSGVSSYRKRLDERGITGFNELVTYADLHKRKGCFDEINELQAKRNLIFVDSGAWSVFNSGKEIDMKHFIQWHKDLERECPDIYFKAGLDVIGNQEGSMRNQTITDDAGLKLFPTFHRQDDDTYLQWLIGRKYEFWGLGGIASGALHESDKIAAFLDQAFAAICDADGRPSIKCHLFGVTNVRLAHQYPAWSNDSTSALMTAMYGCIWVPFLDAHTGQPDWSRPMMHLTVSSESNARGENNAHYLTLRSAQQEIVQRTVEQRGFTMEQVMSDAADRQSYCHVMLMEQAANYPEDVRFKPPVKEFGLFE